MNIHNALMFNGRHILLLFELLVNKFVNSVQLQNEAIRVFDISKMHWKQRGWFNWSCYFALKILNDLSVNHDATQRNSILKHFQTNIFYKAGPICLNYNAEFQADRPNHFDIMCP